MPVQHADNILERYWDGQLPVNPADIALKMGISVLASLDFGDASGHYLPAGQYDNSPTVIYNALEPLVRQRFTIAHEIGHHALQHGEQPRDTSYQATSSNPIERAANAFAAELLMPEKTLHGVIRVNGVRNIDDLAKLFQVSRAAMVYRLKDLGYVR